MAGDAGARLSPREGRRFALTLAAAFAALAGVLAWRGRGPVAAGLAGVAALLFVAGVLVPTRLGPVQRAWMGLAHALSRVTTPVVLGVVYFGVLTPAGWLRRRLGGDPLRRRGETCWVERRGGGRSELRRQF